MPPCVTHKWHRVLILNQPDECWLVPNSLSCAATTNPSCGRAASAHALGVKLGVGSTLVVFSHIFQVAVLNTGDRIIPNGAFLKANDSALCIVDGAADKPFGPISAARVSHRIKVSVVHLLVSGVIPTGVWVDANDLVGRHDLSVLGLTIERNLWPGCQVVGGRQVVGGC